MIVVDTSVLIAMAFNEVEAPRFQLALDGSNAVMSSANILEAHMVMMRWKPEKIDLVDGFIADYTIAIRHSDERQLGLARAAFDRYGKGMGHPAQLTFGDCFAYALSKSLGAPLLFKGNDFARTDVTAAIY